jgi:hypothetical protein
MFRINYKKRLDSRFRGNDSVGQALIELAVFGAVLIFLLGTIVRYAYGNGYTQNQNFKAMRMAMLASWRGSQAGNTARNSASILFVEDRLSPDLNKYGDLERSPFIAQGSGTFSYYLLYPLDVGEAALNLPIMDIYINGQHFPLTTASYVQDNTITPPVCGPTTAMSSAAAQSQCLNNCQPADSQYQTCVQNCQLKSQSQCWQNQCLRNQREWVANGVVNESQFDGIIPVSLTDPSDKRAAAEISNASAIFTELSNEGLIDPKTVTGSELTTQTVNGNTTIKIPGGFAGTPTTLITTTLPAQFISWFNAFVGASTTPVNPAQILSILQGDKTQYKLFYTMVANAGPSATGSTPAADQFSPAPPACADPTSCKDEALSSTLTVKDAYNNLYTNTNGDMQYDLLRMGDYAALEAESQFPHPPSGVTSCSNDTSASGSAVQWAATALRCNIAWQWAATAATSSTMIGLNPDNNEYPSYDIDGRLKEQTIYCFSQNSNGFPTVSYEDNQGGDIDLTWDSNSCTPKPGLQSNAQIFTFTQNGTYLQIKEGKLYNPETSRFVRNANQKDTVDLIQREVQLSNDTYRFCDGVDPTPPAYIGRCLLVSSTDNPNSYNCTPSAANNNCNCNQILPSGNITGVSCTTTSPTGMTYCSTAQSGETAPPGPNPVEVCIPKGAKDATNTAINCFSSEQNIKSTCFDENDNMLFVRSRLEDRRGHFWMTDTSGQLKVR